MLQLSEVQLVSFIANKNSFVVRFPQFADPFSVEWANAIERIFYLWKECEILFGNESNFIYLIVWQNRPIELYTERGILNNFSVWFYLEILFTVIKFEQLFKEWPHEKHNIDLFCFPFRVTIDPIEQLQKGGRCPNIYLWNSVR